MNSSQICATANLRSKLMGALLALFLAAPTTVKACDACGCAMSMSALQILPFFNNDMLSTFNAYSVFQHAPTAENGSGQRVLQDALFRTNLAYRMSIAERAQLQIELPYEWNNRTYEGGSDDVLGVGDFTVRGIYFQPLFEGEKRAAVLRFQPTLSAPTGKYMSRGSDRLILPIGMQAGTGAWSYGGQIDITLRTAKFGAQLSASGFGFTENEMSYNLGARAGTGARFMYLIEGKKSMIIPQIGLNYEGFAQDLEYGGTVDFSGGTRASGVLEINAFFGRMGVQAQAMMPLAQNLPANQPTLRSGVSFGLMYFLGE